MQNTKVLNNKVDKKDEILFLSGECIRASGQLALKDPQAVGPLPSQTYPGLLAWPCSGSPVGLGVLLKGLSLLQQLSKAVKNMTWVLKTASFSY